MASFNLIRSRKGISPILATLLLVVITVAAALTVYAWIMGYISSSRGKAEAMLYIANVRFSGSQIILDIGNSGTANARIVAMYLGMSPSNLSPVTTSPTLPATIQAGSILTFTINQNWSPGTTYYLKVVPETGLPLEFYMRP
ncbi:MAG: archaellin/type IV pilin N-terminal domain-containing protein [Candidatus Bathyarchaeia archaeon]